LKTSKTTQGLKNQTALITGSTRGIGLAIARKFAQRGCNLIIAGRDEKSLQKARRELLRLKICVLAARCDVRDPHSVNALFRSIPRLFPRIDILVNNAGIAHANLPVDQLPFPTWRDIFATNVDGMFLVTQSALGMMRKGAVIVNNLSIAATRVFGGSAAYNASKHAALGFTNTLREELRPRGIRVIGLEAGATDTEIWKTLWPQAPRQKMMSPETVAEAVLAAVLLPPNATMETIEILPSAGTL
jgi:NAD(P)-dependent dehydrogenase (short-subunit alcohol dehydrogenase family)